MVNRIRVKVGADRALGETRLPVCNTEQTRVTLRCLRSATLELGRWSVGCGGRPRDRTGPGLGGDFAVGAVFDSTVLIGLCRSPRSSVHCLPEFAERVPNCSLAASPAVQPCLSVRDL